MYGALNFLIFCFSISVATASEDIDSLRVIPLTTDNTPLKNNTTFNNRTSKNCLFIAYMNKQETLKGIRNLTQQDIQTPSHFESEEKVETIPTTTQQSFSTIHPTLTTPDNKTLPSHKQR